MGKQINFQSIYENVQRQLYAIELIGYTEGVFIIPLPSLRLRTESSKESGPEENVNGWGE